MSGYAVWTEIGRNERKIDFDEKPLFQSPISKAIRALSNFKRLAIFSSEFSVLPPKISEFLRADSPSDANTRKIRGLHRTLNISGLHSTAIFSSCNKHRFGMWYCPFQGLKCVISHPKTAETTGSNGHDRNAGWTITDYTTGYVAIWYGLKWSL